MPKDRKKKIHQVDLGVKFLTACNKFLQQNNSAEAYLEIKNVKERYMFMLEELLFKLHVDFLWQEIHLKVYQN
jgi:hypothetical protein